MTSYYLHVAKPVLTVEYANYILYMAPALSCLKSEPVAFYKNKTSTHFSSDLRDLNYGFKEHEKNPLLVTMSLGTNELHLKMLNKC